MEMYSKHNEGNYVVPERFIRTLKNKIYKYMTSISKNLYIDKFADLVNEYNHTYFRISKMKPFDVKSSTYIDFDKENSKVGPKLKIVDHVRISKYENIFAKGYDPNWSEKLFVIKKVKNIVSQTYLLEDHNDEEINKKFYKRELQKTNQAEFRIKKVVKKNGDRLYGKWKGYVNSFNSWIDKKDIVI